MVSLVKNCGGSFDLALLFSVSLVVVAVEFLNHQFHISRVPDQGRRQARQEFRSAAREENLVDLHFGSAVESLCMNGIQIAAVRVVIIKSSRVVYFELEYTSGSDAKSRKGLICRREGPAVVQTLNISWATARRRNVRIYLVHSVLTGIREVECEALSSRRTSKECIRLQ